MDSPESVDIFKKAFTADNPAYTQFQEMIERSEGLEWIRYSCDESRVDITMKGRVIARFIPTEYGFKVLYPSGPEYILPMERSDDTRDKLRHMVRINKDSSTFQAWIHMETAHRWADSLISDVKWLGF